MRLVKDSKIIEGQARDRSAVRESIMRTMLTTPPIVPHHSHDLRLDTARST